MNWATLIANYFILDLVFTAMMFGKVVKVTPLLVIVTTITHTLMIYGLIAHLGAFA